MSKYFRITAWERYQHYKNRCPPWIKLHRELLTSRTWVDLDDAGRVLAIACMMLAAATGNKIPAEPGYLRRVAYLNQTPDLQALVDIGFIEFIEEIPKSASAPLAHASEPQADARTETETEERQSRGEERVLDSPIPPHAPPPAGPEPPLEPMTLMGFERFWNLYPKKSDRPQAMREYAAAKQRRGLTDADLGQHAERYARYVDAEHVDERYVPKPGNWLRDDGWLNSYTRKAPKGTDAGANYGDKLRRASAFADVALGAKIPRGEGV